jgi:hypothetical protein
VVPNVEIPVLTLLAEIKEEIKSMRTELTGTVKEHDKRLHDVELEVVSQRRVAENNRWLIAVGLGLGTLVNVIFNIFTKFN